MMQECQNPSRPTVRPVPFRDGTGRKSNFLNRTGFGWTKFYRTGFGRTKIFLMGRVLVGTSKSLKGRALVDEFLSDGLWSDEFLSDRFWSDEKLSDGFWSDENYRTGRDGMKTCGRDEKFSDRTGRDGTGRKISDGTNNFGLDK